ncbi:quinone oxidoreductase family protein [Nocardia cyriacigeorgica]|uniref:quinone oxidoreductase family protein n=2 Tax=Nocardia cyriacigeorgica TaxID=135487 RepID=UPI0018934CAE|nr:zinc-binding dehydrogenase [Nocardia cyriacigeorgica]MBF6452375.1 zinc-binding dehydrogenase [Nocardia cyriacigeorgica]MBF6549544.1 zinc-binding dehydrogenase [Nocardia cyriacigeorgica]
MRRVQYQHSGGPEVLEIVSVDVPTPGPGELLVRVEAIGVTLPVVRKVREQPEPIALGGEIAGEVVAVGEGVESFAPGYRVTGLVFGHGYADYAVVSAAMASPIPDGASAVDAVALVRSGLVALGALDAANPAEGESALVTAAASGVGHLAVQLARIRGAARVVGAVSDPAKADFVRGLGADEVVAYEDESWGAAVDYALEAVGGELLAPALAAVRTGGRLVAYSSGGGTVEAFDLLSGAKSMIGFQIARIAREQPDVYEHWRQELWQYFASGLLHPAVHEEFALEDVAAAHTVIEKRANLGKVVLIP